MWRDRWLVLGVIGAALTCLACLTPALVLLLGAIGLSALTGRMDLVVFPLFIALAAFAVYRYRQVQRKKP